MSQTDLPLSGAAADAAPDPFASRPFARACEIPVGCRCLSWGKHPLECLEHLGTSTTFKSLILSSVVPTSPDAIVFKEGVEPSAVLPEQVEWVDGMGDDCQITHTKGNDLALSFAGRVYTSENTSPEDRTAFLRGLDACWQARVQAEETKAGEIALLRGIYAVIGVPFPSREPKSYGAALKKLGVGAVKASEGLTKKQLDFIEEHDTRKTLRGWCGGARAKLVAAEALEALQTQTHTQPSVGESMGNLALGDDAQDYTYHVVARDAGSVSFSREANGEVQHRVALSAWRKLAEQRNSAGVYDERDPDPDDFPKGTVDPMEEASSANQNGSAEAEPGPDWSKEGGTPAMREAYFDAAFAPPVYIVEASCNIKGLKGRVFHFGPKNIIYGLNMDGKTGLVTAIRLALGEKAPEFGVHSSRASAKDLYNMREPGDQTVNVHLKFSNGVEFGWALNRNGSTQTHGQLPAAVYALDGVEDAVTGHSTGMLGLLDKAGIEVVPRSYVEQVLGPHLATLTTVIKDDTTTKLQGDTPLDQLLGAYSNGLQLVLGGHTALKGAKTRRSGAVKESETISHRNGLDMTSLSGQMTALAAPLGFIGFDFTSFYSSDDERARIMTDVSAKADDAVEVDKTQLAADRDQCEYEATQARGNLTRAEARLAAIVTEGQAAKQATMAHPLPAAAPTVRELELAGAFDALFDFVPVMTHGREGRMACPCCPNETTVEAIAAKAAELKAGPVAARFKAIQSYAATKAKHDAYEAKQAEYRKQRDEVVAAATKALAQADAALATVEARIVAADSNVNPIAASAKAFLAAFLRYRELARANRDSAKWREGEKTFIDGPLTNAIKASKVAADSLREYTVERLRGLIAEFTGDDSIALDVFSRNIVVGQRAKGHDAGIMLGTSKSQTFRLIGNICAMLYGSQELEENTLYLAETGDVAWTEPHLSNTLQGWTNNRLQWFVQSTVIPSPVPEGWTLINLSSKG